MGLQGNLHDMSVADLIQHNCEDRKKAKLIIEHEQKQAAVYFQEGRVVHAALGEIEGEEVIYQVLAWEEGTFSLKSDEVTPKNSITRSWSGLLMEGAKRLDEGNITSDTDVFDVNEYKEEKQMAGKMDELLKEMSGEMNGFVAAAVAGMDGINIAEYSAGKVDLETVTAQLTILLKLANTSADKVGMGIFEDILIQTDREYIMNVFLPGDMNHYMTCVVDRKNGSLGNMRLISKIYSDRFSKIIPR
jgi:predicted regulator of Ras-like GTPase activity (Roadblock/LC7/MglB family)